MLQVKEGPQCVYVNGGHSALCVDLQLLQAFPLDFVTIL